MDKFLSFWNHYNTAIIEGLVALIIIASLYLAFRSFFGKAGKGDVEEHAREASKAGGPSSMDVSEIEKTLQKILEHQAKVASAPRTSAAEDLSVPTNLNPLEKGDVQGASVQESAAEVSQLRLSLNETYKIIESLQAQLAEEQKKVAQGTVAAPSTGNTGMSAQEKEDMTGKIRDLEARLAEYEIISEDIADLSKYREENERLKNELAAAKVGDVGAAPAAATGAPAPAPVEGPASEAPTADLIDDDLMKEFAAAVEGQKATAAAGKAEAAPTSGDDTEKLMSEFENFVSKKS